MKGFVFFLAALGLAAAAPSTLSLKDDLQDFMNLMPLEKFTEITIRYLSCDEQVQKVVEYVESDDFKEIVKLVDALPEYIKFLNYLHAAGLDVYSIVNQLHELLGLELLPVPASLTKGACDGHVTGGLDGLFEELRAILPKEQIKALFQEKLNSSPEFKALIDTLASDEFLSIVQTLKANPKFQELLQRGKDAGINVEAVVKLLKEMIGLQY